MENDNNSQVVLSFQEFANKCRMLDEACRQWCAFIDEAPERRNGMLFEEFFIDICTQKYQEYKAEPSYREECNYLAALSDEERYNLTLKYSLAADAKIREEWNDSNSNSRRKLHLLYSCNEWSEKSKASLILVTTDKKTLYAAIGGEILTGNMNYLGESGGKGFVAFKKDYLAGNDVMKELNYGFVKEIDEALLSAPDTLSEYYTAASEFLATDFCFDPAEFDKAYSSDEMGCGDVELDEEYGDEI